MSDPWGGSWGSSWGSSWDVDEPPPLVGHPLTELPFTSIVREPDASWTYTWDETGAATFRVILRGVQIATVINSVFNYSTLGPPTEPPPLEVVEINQLAESEVYQPRFTVQWYATDDASRYVVQRKSGSSWVGVANVIESGQWVYTYVSPPLEAGVRAEFRVVTISNTDDTSEPRLYARLLACNPEPPNVRISYTNPNVVVGAA